MSSGLRAPTSRAAAISALTVSLLSPLLGCPEEDPVTDEPALILSSTTGTTLEADGRSELTVQVRAFNAEQAPDNAPVTLTVEKGTLGAPGVDDSGRTATLTPTDGKAEFTFQCPFREPGAVRISASNGTVEGQLTVNCVEPRGTYVLQPTPSAQCQTLTASGVASCAIDVLVALRTATEDFPEQGVAVTAKVDAVEVIAPEGATANHDVLAAQEGRLEDASDTVTVITDADGTATLWVYSPQIMLEQRMDIVLTATAPDATELSQTTTVEIKPFVNSSSVVIDAVGSVATGQTLPLRITAHGPDGLAAEGAQVRVWVDAAEGAQLSAGGQTGTELTVTTAAQGSDGPVALVDFIAPAVDVREEVIVRAEYQPDPLLPVRSASKTLRVYPEDALILTAVADPTTIRSDENETATITVNVKRYQNDQEVALADLPVSFVVQTSDSERITFETTEPGIQTAIEVDTNADGVAAATIRAQNDRIRGRTLVGVSVTDPDSGETETTTVEIQVERDPILQSLVFQSAEPAQIGVTGSAYPSSSVVTFQVLDDLSEPIPDVAVRFDVNAASDPSASVVSEGFTDANGIVRTVLSAGTQAGPISVVATATFDDRTLVAESLPIGVFGGLPSFGNSYVVIDRGERIQIAPFTGSVTAVLADRFTNRAPDNLVVQFRAEGGNIDSIVNSGGGSATASFSTGAPGAAPASLYSASGDSWSYGAIVPTDVLALETTPSFEPDGCFDGDSTTTCDVYAMCDESSDVADPNYVYCPLPRDAAGEGCWEKLEAGVLTGNPNDLSADLIAALPADTDVGALLALIQSNAGAIAYFSAAHPMHEAVRTAVDAYLTHNHDCGPKTACLTGDLGGLGFIEGDECPVSPGCMDFDASTHCPQDGLLGVIASTRGEEAFVDLNGNGIFDFADTDGNNRHDPGEPVTEAPGIDFHQVVVDIPEPYLDKSNNGSFDEYFGAPRVSTYDEYRLTDLFSDEDASGTFGYGQGASATFTNQQWDRDKQIFFASHFLAIDAGQVRIGEPCNNVGELHGCTSGIGSSLCVEANSSPYQTGVSRGIAPGCFSPGVLQPGESYRLVFQVVDGNGNCASPGFTNEPQVTADGPIKVSLGRNGPLEENYCGFHPVRDAQRPWLENLPALGARVIELNIGADCESADGPAEATVEVSADPATGKGFSFYVNCPIEENDEG